MGRIMILALAVALTALGAVPASATPVDEPYTIALIPDTQNRVQTDPPLLAEQTAWLVDNADDLNLRFVIHLGDVVSCATCTAEYDRAAGAMDALADAGIGYALTAGNHDVQTYLPTGGPATGYDHRLWKEHFGAAPMAEVPGYGGHKDDQTSSWHTFTAGSEDYLVIALPFGPQMSDITWAKGIIAAHPDHEVILATHDLIGDRGELRASPAAALPSMAGQLNGAQIWDALLVEGRVSWTVNGHVAFAGSGTAGAGSHTAANGRTVRSVFANYQTLGNEPGYLRLLTFYPATGTVRTQTVAPDGSRRLGAAEANFWLADGPPVPFTDVPGNGFLTEITEMYRRGVIGGYSDGTFKPEATVTRQATAAMSYRARPGATTGTCTTPPFADVPTSHPFCWEISQLKSAGLAVGYADGTFRPSATVSREAFTAFLYNRTVPYAGTIPFTDVPGTSALVNSVGSAWGAGVLGGYSDGTFRPNAPVTRQAAAAFLCRYYYALRIG